VWGASGAAVAATSTYLAVLTVSAWRGRAARRRGGRAPVRPRHYAVLIPAHDEERLIGSCLDSLAAVRYPSELVHVHVVADNCSDATVAIARGRGAEVHERIAPDDPGKGPALVWAWRRLVARGDTYDAVVILDADTTVNTEFFAAMDAEFDAGAEAVQSYYSVRDAEQSPVTAFRAAALAARHYLRPLGRVTLGGSAGLHGNGMVFAAPVLNKYEWTSHLTEDIELQLELLLEGTKVAFAPDAVVSAEMPTTLAASQTQHARWERGRVEMARRYVPALARRAGSASGVDRVACADAAFDLALPPFSVVVAVTAAWSGLALVGAARRRQLGLSGVVALTAGVTQTVYVLSALRMVEASPAVYRSLLGAPRIVAWKVRLWAGQLGRRTGVTWVRTARNADRDAAATPVAEVR
jgi:cellulose synthase/poly-beta-1,6-N-acetylglucosamine synthase-like glycosyltransferase